MTIRIHSNQGSVTVAVMVMLSLITVLLISTSVNLRLLHMEIQRIEKIQLKKFHSAKAVENQANKPKEKT